MEIFIFITLIFTGIVAILAGILFKKITFLVNENNKIKNYIQTAINKINQARYGNFQIKLNDREDKLKLYTSLNTLFESIVDRDLVINEYREKEKEDYNLKEEFIAALTHDLKVPIIAQDKTFDLLIQDKFGALTKEQQEVILKLKKSNSDLKEMVISILETCKIENKGVELKIEKNINVFDFINDTIKDFKNLLTTSGDKKIIFHSKNNELFADFDPLQIKIVLNNLISNAIRHSENNGIIDIHLNKIGDTFSIDVIDYGDGIDEDKIQKIFNKYYSITNKQMVQTGLGLYLSNKIIKKHNGIIEVDSKKGEGSVFRIILPIR